MFLVGVGKVRQDTNINGVAEFARGLDRGSGAFDFAFLLMRGKQAPGSILGC